jgi:hypothetical protein
MIPDDFFGRNIPHHMMPRHVRDQVYATWRNAQRFAFSAEASRVAGRLALEAGELVVKHRQFAIPPFPTTYVEMDLTAFMGKAADPDITRPDGKLGYLCDGERVYVFAADRMGHHGPLFSPFCYHLGPPGKPPAYTGPTMKFGARFSRPPQNNLQYVQIKADLDDEELNDPEAIAAGKMMLMLGSTANDRSLAMVVADYEGGPGDTLSQDLCRSFEVEALWPLRSLDMSGWWGDIRNLWSLLLWLNQPKKCRFSDVPPSRRISRGKLKTYTAYRTVEIELGKARTIQRAYLLGAERTPPRDHPVRGSFHHHGGQATGCGHDWPIEPDINGIWQCKRCGRRRWWVTAHRRGDITRGTVVHDYDVKTPEEETPKMVHPAPGADIGTEVTE